MTTLNRSTSIREYTGLAVRRLVRILNPDTLSVIPCLRRLMGGLERPLSQLVKNVGDVPAAVNDTDNLEDAGTLAVED